MKKYTNLEIEIVYLYEAIVGCNNASIEIGDNETPPTNPFLS